MFLYELSIELGVRSSDVVDAASMLGMGEVAPASELAVDQVVALRRHFADLGPANHPTLGATSPPLPAAPSGPLVAEPPGTSPRAGGPPTPPSSWGPPVPTPAAPATTAPSAPTTPRAGSIPPPATFAPPSAPSGTPAFEPPSDIPGVAGPGRGPGSGPIGLPGASLPPSPPTAWSEPPAAPPPGMVGPPVGPAPGPTDGSWSTGQKALVGAAVLLVIGLFGFMVANTGPDRDREREIAATAEALEREQQAAAATSTTQAPTTTEAPSTTLAPNANVPQDLEAFCRGGLAVAAFELRLVAAIVDEDFAELQGLVRSRRAAWSDDLGVMASGAPPVKVDEIERYRSGYIEFFDAVEASRSIDEAYGRVDGLEMAKASNAGQEWGRLVTFHCE